MLLVMAWLRRCSRGKVLIVSASHENVPMYESSQPVNENEASRALARARLRFCMMPGALV
jgi:hypothetical protein